MKNIVVIGAGKIGTSIADLLAVTGDYHVTVADRDLAQLATVPAARNIAVAQVDVADAAALAALFAGKFAVLNAGPFQITGYVATAAASAGIHYLDLTEDVAATRIVTGLAQQAKSAFVPQCGLAPGFITIVATDLARKFEALHDLRLRVGALPQYPSNGLNYNLTWSTDGVINEYCEPCDAIVNGTLRSVPALEELEQFSLQGERYEAFNTSGGLGSLCATFDGKVRNLNYRTIRYPGHAALMKTLLDDLRLRERRDLLKDILEYAVPMTDQDVVIVFVTATGLQAGRLMQETYAHKIYPAQINGRIMSAIKLTTASSICAVLDLIVEGALPSRGLVLQEDIGLDHFLANRFGKVYAQDGSAPGMVTHAA